VFFAQKPGISSQFALAGDAKIKASSGQISRRHDFAIVENVAAGRGIAFQIAGREGDVRIVLLDESDSLALWKGAWQGRERVFLTSAGLTLDGEILSLTSTDRSELTVGVYPAPSQVRSAGVQVRSGRNGVFAHFTPAVSADAPGPVVLEQVQPASPPRDIPLGQGVALAPEEKDFAGAAIWRIRLPENVCLEDDPLLRLHYVGDVARATLNGKLLTDDFYNGKPKEIGLRRHSPEILRGDLRFAILPLRQDAPIYMAPSARPDFGNAASVVELRRVELLPRYQVHLEP
jgi:hypothetical protein